MMAPKNHKILQRYGLALAKQGTFVYNYGGGSDHISVPELDTEAERKIEEAMQVKPNSFSTMLCSAEAMCERLRRRTLREEDVLALLKDLGLTFIRALHLKPDRCSVLQNWAYALDQTLESLVQYGLLSETSFLPVFSDFCSAYEYLASIDGVSLNKSPSAKRTQKRQTRADSPSKRYQKSVDPTLHSSSHIPSSSNLVSSSSSPSLRASADDVHSFEKEKASNQKAQAKTAVDPFETDDWEPKIQLHIPLKPLVAFSLMEHSERVRQKAFSILESLASTARNGETREEAAKHVEVLKVLYANRKEIAASNVKRADETIQILPIKAYREWERSGLSVEMIAQKFDIFMNCLYFIVDKETARDPIFAQQKKKRTLQLAAPIPSSSMNMGVIGEGLEGGKTTNGRKQQNLASSIGGAATGVGASSMQSTSSHHHHQPSSNQQSSNQLQNQHSANLSHNQPSQQHHAQQFSAQPGNTSIHSSSNRDSSSVSAMSSSPGASTTHLGAAAAAAASSSSHQASLSSAASSPVTSTTSPVTTTSSAMSQQGPSVNFTAMSQPVLRTTLSVEELEKIVRRENPKLLFSHLTSIGQGGFGEVFTGESVHDGKKVALKVMNGSMNADFLQKHTNEIEAMRRLNHPNIVSFEDVFFWDNQFWLVMEYCDGGTLENLYQEVYLSESEIAHFIRQICLGLHYLHMQQLAHLDIKAENILLNLNGATKIGDFGLVREVSADRDSLTSMVGTSYWMAPEVIQRKPYGQKVDIYALGCVCLELAEGKPPRHEMGSLRAMFLAATVGPPAFQTNPDHGHPWSEKMIDFLKQTLHMDPKRRPTAAQLLEHPFLLSRTVSLKELRKKLELVFIGASLRANGLL